MDGLKTISALSLEFGGPDYVKGGGGNTSFKTVDTVWVKPSGTSLSEMAPERFVALDRSRLARLYSYSPPSDVAERERNVQQLMADARVPGQTGRPSVETPLHDLLRARFVVHTHPMLVNGLTCGREGAAAAARLFPDALWVPYIDPGYTLSMDVRSRLAAYEAKRGRQPTVLLLENHGIFVCGDTADEVRGIYRDIMDRLRAEYGRRGVVLTSETAPARQESSGDSAYDALHDLLGVDATFVLSFERFDVMEGPLTPDHMVYAKAQPYTGEWTVAGLAAFRERWGYAPRVVIAPDRVYATGKTAKAATLALELARDGAEVGRLANVFGGIQFMSDAARRFIESWEVESYREQQSTKQG